MGLNLAVALREAALFRPDKPAVVLDDTSLSFSLIDQLTDRGAVGLAGVGIRPGDRVLLAMPNVPQFLIAYYAILKAGAVVVPVNVLLKSQELAYHMQDSGASLALVWEDFAQEALRAAASLERPIPVYVAARPGSEFSAEGAVPIEALLATDPPAGYSMVQTEPGDLAVILYTSGTTGRPKGAALTHCNLFMNAWIAARITQATEKDVVLGALPFFHSFGQSAVMNCAMVEASTIALVPRFEPGAVLALMAKEHVSVMAAVPTMYYSLYHHPEDPPGPLSLRLCVSGGAAMPQEVLRAFEERFHAVILEGYGLSETSPIASFNRSAEERRPLSIGQPVWGVELAVWDDQNTPLPAGQDQVGEIVIRGHNVMRGYWNRPEATAEAMAGGWFHTGDLGYRDQDGFFYIVDRKSDMILRGGFNVYPREVEEVLFQHPQVQGAAVIGVHDDRLGEEVMAVIQLKPGGQADEAELITYCKQRVAAYKYPRRVVFVDQLPLGATGKVLKRELRARLDPAAAHAR